MAGVTAPIPEGFVTTAGLHAKFESSFVNANIHEADIEPLITPFHHCDDTVLACTQRYLTATAQWTIKVYALEKQGAFDTPTPQSKALAAERLAAGANMLRDMVVDAWHASREVMLGTQVKTPWATMRRARP